MSSRLARVGDDFQWRTYEDRLTEVLDGRYPAQLTASDIELARQMLHTKWGLAPLGLSPLIFALDLSASSGMPLPTESRWAHPSTHTLTEDKPFADSVRTRDNFVLHLFHPNRSTPFEARLTFAIVRKDIQRRGLGRYSPLYDPSTGETTNSPGMFTHSGEVLWTTETANEAQFYDALSEPLYWLSQPEMCQTLASLAPRFPRQS